LLLLVESVVTDTGKLLLVLDSSAAPGKSRDIATVSRRADVPELDKSLLLSRLGDLEKLKL
jgi:hypothetical protein